MNYFLEIGLLVVISAFIIWLAYWIEYKENQSKWMLLVRKWL